MQCRHLQLALILLSEFKKGTASKWQPYIAALPTSCDTLMHWSDEELEELQYSSTEHEQHFLQKVWLPLYSGCSTDLDEHVCRRLPMLAICLTALLCSTLHHWQLRTR